MDLHIRDVSKTYSNGVQALKDVTLTVPAGMYGLLGPNGAGKSTPMRPDLWKPYPSTPEEAMKTDNTAYRSAVGVALAAAFILVWMVLAVGVLGRAGELADLMYIGVLAVGIIGAIIARFQPHGMARALFATALAQGASSDLIGSIGGRRSKYTGR